MDLFGKCLALAFSLLILGQAYLLRRMVGTWLFPGCIFGLFWFGNTFIPFLVLPWVPVYPYATAFILLCTIAFSLSSVPFDWEAAFRKNAQKRDMAHLYGSPFLRVAFYGAAVSALVFLVLNSFAQGFSVHDLVFDLFTSATSYAELRYSEGLNSSIFSPLCLICGYLGVILGGLLYPSVPSRAGRRIIVALSFLPSVLVAVTQSSKGFLGLCIVFFYSGLLVRRLRAGTLRLFERSNIKTAAVFAVVIIIVVSISFVAGGLFKIGDQPALAMELAHRYSAYGLGHAYAFSDWFAYAIGGHSEIAYSRVRPSYGYYTFAPLFRLFGSRRTLPLGVYDEEYSYGEWLVGNIYTMFRGLILDFGFIGSILFMIVAGFFLHWSFLSMLRKNRPVFTVAVFIFMMGYIYASFGVSLLFWSNVYVGFALVWITLRLNEFLGTRRRKAPASAAVEGGIA